MATPAIGAVGTPVSFLGTGTLSLPVPSGVVSGSLVVLAVGCEWNETTPPTTSSATATGFTCAAVASFNSGGFEEAAFLLYKYATAADTGSYVVTFATLGFKNPDESAGVAAIITGGPTSGNPFVDSFESATGSSNTATVATFTPTAANSLLLAVGWCDDNLFTAIPSGWTNNAHTTTGGQAAIVLASLQQTTAVSTGSLAFTAVDDVVALVGTIRAPGGSSFTGTLALTGSGTATEAGVPNFTPTIALSGSGTATEAGAPHISNTLAASGSGLLTNTTAAQIASALALTGSGTLGITASVGFSGTLALTGSGTATDGTAPHPANTLPLTGSGTATEAGTPAINSTLGLTGSGSATEVGTPSINSTLPLTGSGSLSEAATAAINAALALSGIGLLTDSTAPHINATITLTGSGTLTESGVPGTPVLGTLGLSGSGGLAESGVPAITSPLGLSGSGTLTESGAPHVNSALANSGTGTLTLSGTMNPDGTLALGGSGQLTLSGTASSSGFTGTLNSTGDGQLTLSGVAHFFDTLHLTGVGTATFVSTNNDRIINVTATLAVRWHATMETVRYGASLSRASYDAQLAVLQTEDYTAGLNMRYRASLEL